MGEVGLAELLGNSLMSATNNTSPPYLGERSEALRKQGFRVRGIFFLHFSTPQWRNFKTGAQALTLLRDPCRIVVEFRRHQLGNSRGHRTSRIRVEEQRPCAAC